MGNKKIINPAQRKEEKSNFLRVEDASFVDFFKLEPCRDWVLRELHPQGAFCPECTAPLKGNITLKNFWAGKRCKCDVCALRFTALSKTAFQGSHLNYHEIFAMALLISLQNDGLKISTIAKTVRVSENTARRWVKKFKLLTMLRNQEHEEAKYE